MVDMVKATVNGCHELFLPKHRAERPEWYTHDGWEKPRMDALAVQINNLSEELNRAPVLYYVGAEEGDLAAICAMEGADLFLFEPNPLAWPNIKAIWDTNNLLMPVCFAGFASNVTEMQHAPCIRMWPEATNAEAFGDHGFKELYLEADNYPQIRLDQVWSDLNHPPPDIISFDVEGSEWQVLRGAERTLREYRPTLFASIHPEFMFHQWGEYSTDFRRWIEDFGYRETILDYAHELHCMYEAA